MKKILYAMLALFGILVLGACSDDKNQANNMASEKVYKVGIAANYPPFDFVKDTQITGFDVDLLEEIAKRENFKLEWVNMSFDGLIPALKSGKIDMIASAMSSTPQRLSSMDFSNTYFNTKNLYLKLKTDSSLSNKESLEGKKIGVQLGTIQENAAKMIPNSQVVASEEMLAAILALKAGKVDAVLTDKDIGKGYLKTNDELEAFLEEDDGSSGFCIAFDKGQNAELIQKINTALEKIKSDGTYQKIVEKYDLQ
ncbi:basic amino acid ABC transporter substrate-binding protein [Campylobacter insulaenigrae]|uniref:Basic amino acid ABC transporter substrate-binding protein n=1 Tax=Campylobacter insulaenigrae TaxID=260714 RepID=A0ABY3G6J9_9BACT|nr:basic amino acid ABC transporter substrate-binding protein [Campylobacter insulaenigrae]MCR6570858.1 basic amino acid ABC transporter substrate-binding protein [Campylobacter insulaenigrae]MCR6572484.1 basic amino acid ABC transporter substrate-binding protein [Campylobacter insulaenigrae]MCR6575345.1 basic amino acid ABC transporter substrate-binding protein [Campylobacter insulaenigrae]MCR6576855.1 basic amino acid ABC transporter substrate-binding protein [Campylobacter insulaenigrae]MCR